MTERLEPSTVAIVLAAGEGSRFEGPGHKLLAPLPDGDTVLGRALATAIAAAIGPVVVVLGDLQPDDIQPALPGPAAEPGHRATTVRVVVNPQWADGQASSLLAGIAEADRLGATAAVVALGDQPGLTVEAWRAVAHADPDAPVAIARYAPPGDQAGGAGSRRAHPVRLARSVWPLLHTAGDEGARSLIAAHPEWVCEVDVAGDPFDIDTVADLAAWRTQDVTTPPVHPPPPPNS